MNSISPSLLGILKRMIKHKNRNIHGKYKIVLSLIVIMLLCTACGSDKVTDAQVSDEVTKALTGDKTDSTENLAEISPIPDEKINGQESEAKADTETDVETEPAPSSTDVTSAHDGVKYGENPFLGYSSTATQYNIKYTIDTDSGIAGIAWGFTEDKDYKLSVNGNRITGKATKTPGSDYYIAGIDLTGAEFPKFYISRRCIDPKNGREYIFEEATFNLDMLYPKVDEYLGHSHYVELQIDGTALQVIIDSVPVASATLYDARPIGQIGTYVMVGNYHAEFDEIKILEGITGDGEYLYVDDFTAKTNIFTPYLEAKSGKLYAKSGLYMVHREP